VAFVVDIGRAASWRKNNVISCALECAKQKGK
jgi:hypothetical protein